MTCEDARRALESEITRFGRLMRERQCEPAARSRIIVSQRVRALMAAAELDGRRAEAKGLAAMVDVAEDLR